MAFIPYGKQCIDEADIEAVAAALRSDFLTTGPLIEVFEGALGARVGAGHTVVCSSGTAALHLSVLALGLGPGDVAIVPSMTFAATANAVRYVGAEVVFSDVDPDTGLMGPGDFEEALENSGDRNFRAVLPVHYAGQCVDIPGIAEIAAERGITVIEDASHAIGTHYGDGQTEWPVGACAHSHAVIFSFHPVKTIAMGEGGAVTTNDAAYAERLRKFRSHGIERDHSKFVNQDAAGDPWYYELSELGFNYRATDIQCALGISQLGKLDKFVSRRAELVARYDELIAPLSNTLRPLARVKDCVPAWHLYPVMIDFSAARCTRKSVMDEMREKGIGTQVHYTPLHMQPYYRDRYGVVSLEGAEMFYERVLSLPLYPQLTDNDQNRVIEVLSAALDH